jgi:hypothetical protein
MTTSSRIVVLVSGKSVRRYPLLDGVALKDSYEMDGRQWTVTAVLTSEDVPLKTETLSSIHQ